MASILDAAKRQSRILQWMWSIRILAFIWRNQHHGTYQWHEHHLCNSTLWQQSWWDDLSMDSQQQWHPPQPGSRLKLTSSFSSCWFLQGCIKTQTTEVEPLCWIDHPTPTPSDCTSTVELPWLQKHTPYQQQFFTTVELSCTVTLRLSYGHTSKILYWTWYKCPGLTPWAMNLLLGIAMYAITAPYDTCFLVTVVRTQRPSKSMLPIESMSELVLSLICCALDGSWVYCSRNMHNLSELLWKVLPL